VVLLLHGGCWQAQYSLALVGQLNGRARSYDTKGGLKRGKLGKRMGAPV
jgi:hypothetical protein